MQMLRINEFSFQRWSDYIFIQLIGYLRVVSTESRQILTGSLGITIVFFENIRFHRYSKFFITDYSAKRQVLLPEKELRYLRTIIVIADIDEGLSQ